MQATAVHRFKELVGVNDSYVIHDLFGIGLPKVLTTQQRLAQLFVLTVQQQRLKLTAVGRRQGLMTAACWCLLRNWTVCWTRVHSVPPQEANKKGTPMQYMADVCQQRCCMLFTLAMHLKQLGLSTLGPVLDGIIAMWRPHGFSGIYFHVFIFAITPGAQETKNIHAVTQCH